ncbi:phage tail assembly protein [Brevundimonas nasdae]|uniref:phage tail assembly protein n=1 Tax=Brevundimonas nasdae TaxID=172043 RepID=UPI003F68FAE7
MATPVFHTADFDEGFERGSDKILKVRLRRPQGGELRGLSNVDLVRQEYAAIEKVTPRISDPAMTAADVASLSPADLMTLGSEIAAFFLTRQQKAELGLDA